MWWALADIRERRDSETEKSSWRWVFCVFLQKLNQKSELNLTLVLHGDICRVSYANCSLNTLYTFSFLLTPHGAYETYNLTLKYITSFNIKRPLKIYSYLCCVNKIKTQKFSHRVSSNKRLKNCGLPDPEFSLAFEITAHLTLTAACETK